MPNLLPVSNDTFIGPNGLVVKDNYLVEALPVYGITAVVLDGQPVIMWEGVQPTDEDLELLKRYE